jgi:hypothetical protein
MSADVFAIVLANLSYALFGIGVAAVLGMFDKRRSTWPRAAIGVPLGLALVMLISSYAALLGIAVGPNTMFVLVAVVGVAGWWRLRAHPTTSLPGLRAATASERLLAVLPAAAIVVICFAAARNMAVKPLVEWDGWVVWATKAKILYGIPGDAAAVLQQGNYPPPSYPFGLPALEATTMRAVGHFDNALVDMQLLALVAAALIGIWVLLRPVASPLVISIALLGPLASSQVTYQLTTNYADVPLAFLIALGVVAGAAWLGAGERRDRSQLICFAVFLGAAAWTKNEGLVFGCAAVLALAVATLVNRTGRRDAALACAGFLALALPWRLYAIAKHLPTQDYDLRNLFDIGYLRDHADRVLPTASELLQEMTVRDAWGLSLVVIVLGIASALLTSRRVVGLYAATWLGLSFGGLVVTYWIATHSLDNDLENSSFRTIVTLLVTGLCLLPALLQPLVDDAVAALRGRVTLSTLRDRRSRRAAS